MVQWNELLDDFGKSVLDYLGVGWAYGLPTDRNPVTDALKDGDFIAKISQETWFDERVCRNGLSRTAVLCQMAVYDQQGGPDSDNERKGLRRHWYSYYKTQFAQPLHNQLSSGEEFNGIQWSGRMSETYSGFVKAGEVTYWDLWVHDISRMMQQFWARLYRSFNVIVAVEKDSLYGDFEAVAKALGAPVLVSGKGKQSMAATEKVLRDFFGWRQDRDPFSEDEPLIILHLSDHDYDGESVIGPTFGEQSRRYTPHVLEARVGINPATIPADEWQADWYDLKVNNVGYYDWSCDKALFLAECATCGREWPVQGGGLGRAHECPDCHSEVVLTVAVKKGSSYRIEDQPYGFEVEARPTRAYYPEFVDALLTVVPFDLIIEKLRDECTADPYEAARQVAGDVYEENTSYRALVAFLARFEDLERAKDGFEQDVLSELTDLGEPHAGDWNGDDPDPDPNDFRQHVARAGHYAEPWRPFKRSDRTAALAAYLRDEEWRTIRDLGDRDLGWEGLVPDLNGDDDEPEGDPKAPMMGAEDIGYYGRGLMRDLENGGVVLDDADLADLEAILRKAGYC